MNDSKKPAIDYITNHHDLNFLLSKVKTLNTLDLKVKAYLESPYKEQCQVANLTNRKLVILVPNSAIASMMKYQVPDLLKTWEKDIVLKEINEIEIKVRLTFDPKERLNSEPINNTLTLSSETAAMMYEIAESLDDPKLRAVMQKIAGHVGKDK